MTLQALFTSVTASYNEVYSASFHILQAELFRQFFFDPRPACLWFMNTTMCLLLSLLRLFQYFIPNLAVHRSSTRSARQLARHSTTMVLNRSVALHRLFTWLWVRDFTLKASWL